MESLACTLAGQLKLTEGAAAGAVPASASTAVVQVITTVTETLQALAGVKQLVALDAEGVDLSRHGKISIVQIATPEQCFLLDVLGRQPTDPLVSWLGKILSDPSIVKIIHDCRMDADALHHQLGVDLINVHDTSCWHAALVPDGVDKNLNDTLSAYGLAPNKARNGSVYRTNPEFWATRPLTQAMVEWASGDVTSMFALYHCQQEHAHGLSQSKQQKIKMATSNFLSWKKADVTFVTVRNPGRFIGKGGCNIRRLQQKTGTIIYPAPTNTPGFTKRMFMVYHRDASAKCAVEEAARA
jgi:exonuclease 3'-5' domain-containing protein 1